MTVSITFRNDAGGNPGKGANLTPGEVDSNFLNLKDSVEALQGIAFTGESIGAITVAAGEMTISGDQGSAFGSFALPVATFTAAGEWATATPYALNDIVTYHGAGYVCAAAHTAAASFEADAGLATPRWKPISGSGRARSPSTVTAAVGERDFAVPPGQLFAVGDRVRAVSGDRMLIGSVVAYGPDPMFDAVFWKLRVAVAAVVGSGAAAGWAIVNDSPVELAVTTVTEAAAALAVAAQGMVLLEPDAAQTVTLPPAAPGLWYALRNIAAAHNTTVEPDGSETIEGAASLALPPDHGAVVASDGAGWRIIAAFRPPRAITGTAGEIAVADGDGVGGDPVLSLPAALTLTGKTVTGGTLSGPTLAGTVALPSSGQIASGGSLGIKRAATTASLEVRSNGNSSIRAFATGDTAGQVSSLEFANDSGALVGSLWATGDVAGPLRIKSLGRVQIHTGEVAYSGAAAQLQVDTAGNLQMAGSNTVISAARHHRLRAYTVATLPSATAAGDLIYVSDESGGAVPCFADGSDWRRITDRAVVS